MTADTKAQAEQHRSPDHPIEPLFSQRWSQRAMSGEAVDTETLMSLFEAARWAPSCYNAQPWRFIYAGRDSEHWETLFSLLVEFNQSWCANAAALVVVTSTRSFEWGEAYPSHSFDAGAAWQNLALQGSALNLVVHGMAGFDYERAKSALNIPDDQAVEAMIAIGRPAPVEVLPEDLRAEEKPSDRKPVREFVFEGPLPG